MTDGPRPRPGGSQRGPTPDPVRRPAPGVTELREGHRTGYGSPEAVVYAGSGTLYRDIDPAGSGSIWKKTTPSGNTGWVELGAGGGGGFTPIAAAVYDGFDSGTDPIGERSNAKFKVSDAGVSGDTGQITQTADGTIPPNFANNWLRYVRYDDGFGASAGNFTVPEDGVYQIHGRLSFVVITGVVDDCNLRIKTLTGTAVTVTFAEGPRNVLAGAADVLLEASGQAFLAAGSEMTMSVTINMSGLTGLPGSTDLIWIPRPDWGSPPPTESIGPGDAARFSITQIA